jgi:hypothetical protein
MNDIKYRLCFPHYLFHVGGNSFEIRSDFRNTDSNNVFSNTSAIEEPWNKYGLLLKRRIECFKDRGDLVVPIIRKTFNGKQIVNMEMGMVRIRPTNFDNHVLFKFLTNQDAKIVDLGYYKNIFHQLCVIPIEQIFFGVVSIINIFFNPGETHQTNAVYKTCDTIDATVKTEDGNKFEFKQINHYDLDRLLVELYFFTRKYPIEKFNFSLVDTIEGHLLSERKIVNINHASYQPGLYQASKELSIFLPKNFDTLYALTEKIKFSFYDEYQYKGDGDAYCNTYVIAILPTSDRYINHIINAILANVGPLNSWDDIFPVGTIFTYKVLEEVQYAFSSYVGSGKRYGSYVEEPYDDLAKSQLLYRRIFFFFGQLYNIQEHRNWLYFRID